MASRDTNSEANVKLCTTLIAVSLVGQAGCDGCGGGGGQPPPPPGPDAYVPAPDAFVPAPDAFVPPPDAFVPTPDAPGVDAPPPCTVDCGRIAFASTRDGDPEIYTVRPDGTGLTRLTFSAGNDTAPSWSPDGQRIAFLSSRGGDDQIFVMNADGSNVVALTTGSADGPPSWSAEGQLIVYPKFINGSVNTWTVGANVGGPPEQSLLEANGWEWFPNYSPDGTKLVLTTDWNFYDGVYDIWVGNANGLGFSAITNDILDQIDFINAKWSPDGTKFACLRSHTLGIDQFEVDLVVMNVDGTGVTSIAPVADRFGHVTWSPDGTMVSYVTRTGSPPNTTTNIQYAHVNGAGAGLVITNGYAPAWRPTP